MCHVRNCLRMNVVRKVNAANEIPYYCAHSFESIRQWFGSVKFRINCMYDDGVVKIIFIDIQQNIILFAFGMEKTMCEC